MRLPQALTNATSGAQEAGSEDRTHPLADRLPHRSANRMTTTRASRQNTILSIRVGRHRATLQPAGLAAAVDAAATAAWTRSFSGCLIDQRQTLRWIGDACETFAQPDQVGSGVHIANAKRNLAMCECGRLSDLGRRLRTH
jgi:hypothetical protein